MLIQERSTWLNQVFKFFERETGNKHIW